MTEGDRTTVSVSKTERSWYRGPRSPLLTLLLALVFSGLLTIQVLSNGWLPGRIYEAFAQIIAGVAAALYVVLSVVLLLARRHR